MLFKLLLMDTGPLIMDLFTMILKAVFKHVLRYIEWEFGVLQPKGLKVIYIIMMTKPPKNMFGEQIYPECGVLQKYYY